MSVPNHPFLQEDVMAFLDGEFSIQRSAEFRLHLEDCAECAVIALDLRGVSHQMQAWKVAPVSDRLVKTVSQVAVGRHLPKNSASQTRSLLPHRIWVPLAGVAAVVLLAMIAIPNLLRSRMAGNEASAVGSLRTLNTAAVEYSSTYGHYPRSLQSFGPPPNGTPSEEAAGLIDSVLARGRKSGYLFSYYSLPPAGNGFGAYSVHADPIEPDKSGSRHFSTDQTGVLRYDGGLPLDGGQAVPVAQVQEKVAAESQAAQTDPYSTPMIARSVDLSLFVNNLNVARSQLDRVLAQQKGYLAKLSASEEGSSQRTLIASLRVPAEQLDACITELKKLGRMAQEVQTGEEVTQQHTDLLARLKNARNTERRLNGVLQQHTGKVNDILEVEKESARVRGEIERMEAEQKNLKHRVEFATIDLKLSEDYKAQLNTPAPAISTQLRNALVNGFRTAFETLLAIVLFLSESGPTLLLWLLILFFPARSLWRRYRRAHALGV